MGSVIRDVNGQLFATPNKSAAWILSVMGKMPCFCTFMDGVEEILVFFDM